jgi:hypothetical protein
MKFFLRVWFFLSMLSIDVVLGAMAGMVFFSDLLEVNLPFILYLLLGLAVWSIYTLDHLLDAKKIKHNASSDRHHFHQRYSKQLGFFLGIVVVLGLGLSFNHKALDVIVWPALTLGALMAMVMGLIYFSGKKLSWLKELMTAGFYVLGIVLAPFFFLNAEKVTLYFYFFVLAYFILACLNLYILSFDDQEKDQRDGLGTVLQWISSLKLKRIILITFIFGVGLTLTLLVVVPSFYKIHAGILLLLMVFHIYEFYKDQNLYLRQKLEASFLFPYLLLFM